MEHVEITVYGIKVLPNGYPSKIRAIKVLKEIASLQDYYLPLKAGKEIIDRLDSNNPLVIMLAPNEVGIVKLAIEQFFITDKPTTSTTYLGQYFTTTP